MNYLKYLGLLVSLVLFTACTSKFQPAYSFKTEDKIEKETKIKLQKHSRSDIQVEAGKVIKLNLDSFYIASDGKSDEGKNDSIGNRELLLYAKIYRNGIFVQYKNLINISEHMWLFNPSVINDTNIFTETINDNYRIELKAYEVDTVEFIKTLRFVKNTDLSKFESNYAPGDSFTTGFKKIVVGLFDSVSGLLSGRTIDDLVGVLNAEPIFEHSIYITKANSNIIPTGILIIGGNGNTTELVKKGNNSDINNLTTYNTFKKDFINKIEGAKNLKIKDIRSGDSELINKYPYLFITIDKLEKKND